MIASRHNIFGKFSHSERWYLVNLLSRQADILDTETAEAYQRGAWGDNPAWAEKGYLVESREEVQRYKSAYLDFLDRREKDEIQLFFVPTYACNFACSYCYQAAYDQSQTYPSSAVLEAWFSYVDQHFAGKRKYLTLFGGEPLLNSAGQREFVEAFLKSADQRQLETAIVTNGYTLVDYVPLLARYRIREIQVTLDGLADVHDRRRPLKGGGSSFERIVEGITLALHSGIAINLRMVLDRDNISELPQVASLAIEKGWTTHPLFKTQLGRNYELHTCQAQAGALYSRVELYEDLARLIPDAPQILDFHRPAFSLSKFLWEQGELPAPLYDSCPGTKTEWAFDASGKIFSCTATVGKAGEELGTFYPAVTLKQDQIDDWEERDVTSIPECQDCSLALACGGGCASVAKNQTGRVHSPDCRPIRELLSLGLDLYFPETPKTKDEETHVDEYSRI